MNRLRLLPQSSLLVTALLSVGVVASFFVLSDQFRSLRGDVALTIDNCAGLAGAAANPTFSFELTQDIDCTGYTGFEPIGTSSAPYSGTFNGAGYTISNLTVESLEGGFSEVGVFGFVGTGGIIQNLAIVNATVDADTIAGIVAGANRGTIEKVYTTGTVQGTTFVGGVVGQNYTDGTVQNAYSTATVTGTEAGGLIGINEGTALNTYASGTVSNSTVGGLAGTLDINGSILNSFAVGNVSSNNATEGGLVGTQVGGTISGGYWNNHGSNPSECYSGGDIGCTAISNNVSYFYDATNEPMVQWDFASIWYENASDLPTLQLFTDPVPEISITGYLYASDGSTPLASKDVSVSLNGGAKAGSGTTDAGGQFTISSGLSSMTGGTIVTLYVDNESEKGVTVTLGSGSTMTGINVYQNTLIVRGGYDGTALTNSHVAVADNVRDFDQLQVFEVIGNSLFVRPRSKLLVWNSESYTPGAKVFAGSGITINGTLSMGSYSGSLVGDWTLSGGGTFNAGTSTIAFVGSGQTIRGVNSFYNLEKKASEKSITTLGTSGADGFYNAVAIGADGLPVVAFYDSSTSDLKIVKCGNKSCTSNNTVTTVDSANSTGLWPAIAVAPDGLPVVSYYYSTGADFRILKCGNAACSSGNTITTVQSTSAVGGYSSIAIGSDGLPIASYYDSTADDLIVAKCSNAACTASTKVTVDSANDVGFYTSLAIGRDGFPVITYLDNTADDLKFVQCGNLDCSSGNTKVTLDSTGNVGTSNAVAIAPDGFPVVSYTDITNGDLKVVKCGNAACSSGNTITSPDTTDSTGWYTHLAIGANGLPIVSYVNATSFDLKILACGNAACTSNNTITTVDSADSVGRESRITIGADGLAVVSYYDWTNDSIKLLQCADAACSTDVRGGLLTFEASVEQSVTSNLVLQGTGGGITSLRSTTNGVAAQLSLDVSGNQNIDHVDVKDNDASGGQELVCETSAELCVNSGNATNWNFGSNTPNISTCEELQAINSDLDGDYQLIQDIDCSDTVNWNGGLGFDPIGNWPTRFTGTFDGSGYTISDVYINRPTSSRVGLFEAPNSPSTIENVRLTNAYVEGNSNVGVIAGQLNGAITNVSMNGTVSGSTLVGGLVGVLYDTLSGSYATGTVSGLGDYVGGLVGDSGAGNHIENSYAGVAVTGDNYVGGLMGRAYSGELTVINSYATGSVVGTNNVGGLIGEVKLENVYGSYATGNVTGVNGVGGLIGQLTSSSTLSGSYATGTVTATNNAGGLVGVMSASTSIYRSYATGDVSNASPAGGFVGATTGGSIDDAYATGDITGTDDTGGFVGFNGGTDITNAYATGDVVGTNYVGGFAGENDSGSIADAFSVGSVTGASVIGGFLSQPGAIGTISGVRWFDQSGDGATDCYNGGNTDCLVASALSTFYGSTNAPMASWDFSTVWTSNTCDYPTLTGITQEAATACSSSSAPAGGGNYCGDGQRQGNEQCDRGALNVPLSFANATDDELDADTIAVLIRSNCLETCRYAQCGDGIDNDGDGLTDATSPKDGQGNVISVYDVTLETSDPGCLVGQPLTGNQTTPYLQGRNSEWNACVYPSPYQEYGFLTQTGSSSSSVALFNRSDRWGNAEPKRGILASIVDALFGWFSVENGPTIALSGQVQGSSSSSMSATWYFAVDGSYVTSMSSSSAAAAYRCLPVGDRTELGGVCNARPNLDYCAATGSLLRCKGPVKNLGEVCVSRSDCKDAFDADGVLRGNEELSMDVFCAKTTAEAQAMCCTNAAVYTNGSSSSSVPAAHKCALPRSGDSSSANPLLIPNCAGGLGASLNAKPLTCGNEIVEGREQCDDGNAEEHDECSNICTEGSLQRAFIFLDQHPVNGALILPEVWSGTTLYQEQLFATGTGYTADFNQDLIVDSKDAQYIITLFNYYFSCGDGVLDIDDGEQCDDGNNSDGDGCSIFCKAESGAVLPVSGTGSSSSVSSSGAVISSSSSSVSSSLSSLSSQSSSSSLSSSASSSSSQSSTSSNITASSASSTSVLSNTVAANPLFCGDGVLSAPAEECEVGFACTSAGDVCNQVTCLCTPKNVPICGDGLINQPSEQCEQGVACSGEFDTCNAFTCGCEPPPFCGDGELNVEGEQCERGIACPEGQTCNPNSCGCIVPVCGDGLVNQPSEECDEGDQNSNSVGSACRTDCTLGTANPVGFCGDGLINRPDEECERGIACGSSGDVCNQFSCQCTPSDVPICGDGLINQDSEQCEAGIKCAGQFDACNGFTCACEPPPICGDGLLNQSFERCEVGVSCPSGQSCDPNSCGCVTPVCGDGVVNQKAEECDDGNLIDNDGCNALCRSDSLWFTVALSCGNGLLEAGEQCDDGNVLNGDGCSALCQSERIADPELVAACGDGIVNGQYEQCDDGNVLDGDGCSAFCRIESDSETLPATVIELPFTVGSGNGSQQQDPVLIGQSGSGGVHSGAPSYPPENTSSGPATLVIMLAGAIAGLLWQRKRKMAA